MTEAYPLQWPAGWPRTSDGAKKVSSPFRTTFDKARRELLAELARLGARDIVISSWLPLRNDGFPRADAAKRAIADPGVAVYFTLRKRQMVMARDAYWSVHDNLRSIGLAIEHLRGLERHGGAAMMERAFDGFAQIEAPGAKHWSLVLNVARDAGAAQINEAFRRLARERHPDQGGSEAMMAELNVARDRALKEIATHG
jgi:hypothetical protein